jgi:prolyl-tRNA synthetase
MYQSQLFTKTAREAPADEVAKNAQLLLRAGYVFKEMGGVYTYLPLGLRVLNKIANIIREEMNAMNAQEVLMPALQIKERYEATGRWSDEVVDNWFKTKLANGTELGLGFSHEENLAPIVKHFLTSYKELPFSIYQIQTKFRNELRSKSGLMRGREFLMKDMYSFALTEEQHQEIYARAQQAYTNVFQRVGIGERTFMTFASGGSFSKYSHEFQTLSDAGEDTIYLSRTKNIAINKEVYNEETLQELGVSTSELEEVKAIEVGNIFSLGTKFSAPFSVQVQNEKGVSQTVIMGCYGIGVSRIMGTIAELLSDERGLVWPENIAPFSVHIVAICKTDDSPVYAEARSLYTQLTEMGIECLFDDRIQQSTGARLGDADLLGIPHRIVISERTLESNSLEYKKRSENDVKMMSRTEFVQLCTKKA